MESGENVPLLDDDGSGAGTTPGQEACVVEDATVSSVDVAPEEAVETSGVGSGQLVTKDGA